MAAIPAAAHVVAWAVLGSGLTLVLLNQREASNRLDAIEQAKAEAPAAVPAGDPGAKGRDQATFEAKLAAAETRQTTELGAMRKEVQKLWAEMLKGTGTGEGAGANPAAQAGFDDAVRGVIDRYAMEHKFRETIQKATGPLVPKKPAFVQLATALKLRPEQAERFGNEIRGIQQELFEILQLPRSDGVSPLEDIQQAEQYPEGHPKKAEAFLKLFKLTIPGTQETYIERAVALASRVKEGTKTYFDADQTGTLDTLDLDWFGIKMQ